MALGCTRSEPSYRIARLKYGPSGLPRRALSLVLCTAPYSAGRLRSPINLDLADSVLLSNTLISAAFWVGVPKVSPKVISVLV
jgi:hypothetical protein